MADTAIYYHLNQIEEAIIHFKKCVQVAHQYKMLDSEITGLTHLAECYQKQKNIPELTDELAKEFGYESVSDFTTKNKERSIKSLVLFM
jgi:hypothetical protein